MTTGQCYYCHESTGLQCQCGQHYCGDLHLKIHRPGQYCLPFRVAYSDTVGRYLVASRDIKPLELVLWDTASALGPCADSVPVCLECGDKVDGSYQCPKCQVSSETYCHPGHHQSLSFSFLCVERNVRTREYTKQNVKYFPNLRRRLTFQTCQRSIQSTPQSLHSGRC